MTWRDPIHAFPTTSGGGGRGMNARPRDGRRRGVGYEEKGIWSGHDGLRCPEASISFRGNRSPIPSSAAHSLDDHMVDLNPWLGHHLRYPSIDDERGATGKLDRKVCVDLISMQEYRCRRECINR
ncbi:hypothetical protein SUGI_0510790 [Cryptomeria japonica]|nr:hypothetical protein SUGI_0510790 [Cryptomeria japonica]